MDKFGLFAFVCCICFVSSTLVIKEVKGPGSIENGTIPEVVLDCDFEAVNESGVVLKWFYNGEIEQIYQWIPETGNHGFPSGNFRNNIDIEYKVNDDKDTRYRALKMKEINTDMTGNYTCKVSSDKSEVTSTKQLIIYSPPPHGLHMVLVNNESTIVCSASRVFPKPDITIVYTSGNETTELLSEEEEDFHNEEGLYTVTKMARFDEENITSHTTFSCRLTIPGTDYVLVKNKYYYIEPAPQELNVSQIDEGVTVTENVVLLNFTQEDAGVSKENSSVTNLRTSGTLLSLIPLLIYLLFK